MVYDPYNLIFFFSYLLLHRITPRSLRFLLNTNAAIIFLFNYSPLSAVIVIASALQLSVAFWRKKALTITTSIFIVGSMALFVPWDLVRFEERFHFEWLLVLWFNLARVYHIYQDYYQTKADLKFQNVLSYLLYPCLLFGGPLERFEDYQRGQDKKKIDYLRGFRLLVKALFLGFIARWLSYYIPVYALSHPELCFAFERFSIDATWQKLILYVPVHVLLIYYHMASWFYFTRAISIFAGISFQRPHFGKFWLASSPNQFWNRWNITFTRFTQDYIFFEKLSVNFGVRTFVKIGFYYSVLGLLHVPSWYGAVWGFLSALAVLYNSLLRLRALQNPQLKGLLDSIPRVVKIVATGTWFLTTTALLLPGWPSIQRILESYFHLLVSML